MYTIFEQVNGSAESGSAESGLFGPYCGRRSQWSIFTLEHFAEVIYKPCGPGGRGPPCNAQVIFIYEVMEHNVVYYSEKPILTWPAYMQEITELQVNNQKPVVTLKEYDEIKWLIRVHVYQKL